MRVCACFSCGVFCANFFNFRTRTRTIFTEVVTELTAKTKKLSRREETRTVFITSIVITLWVSSTRSGVSEGLSIVRIFVSGSNGDFSVVRVRVTASDFVLR